MSCVLRVTGSFDPKRFLVDSPWQADATWRRGERRAGGRAPASAGFNVVVSTASFGAVGTQIRQATTFLRRYAREFARLRALSDFAAVLDFGVAQRARPAWSVKLPAKLVELAADSGVGIELSMYAISDEC